jgi:molybdopterin-binding protein
VRIGIILTMPISARNQFPGTVVSVRGGSVMSEVVIDIGGGHRIVSLISTSSAKRLKLKKGLAPLPSSRRRKSSSRPTTAARHNRWQRRSVLRGRRRAAQARRC